MVPEGRMPEGDEASRAAMEDLRSREEEQPLPAAPDRRYVPPFYPEPVRDPAPSRSAAWQAAPRTVRGYASIEELCDAFPSIGDGETVLRIHRNSPTSWRGQNAKGWVVDKDSPCTIQGFADEVGGGKYTVSVVGPRPGVSADGHRPVQVLASISVEVIGDPILPAREEKTMTQSAPAGESERVQIRRLELDRERELRGHQASDRDAGGALGALRSATDRSIEIIEKKSEDTVAVLRDQLSRHLQSIVKKDGTIDELRDQLAKSARDLAETRHDVETEALRRLREEHSKALQARSDEYDKTVNRLTTEHARTIEAESRRAADERTKLIADGQRERDDARKDAERREKTLTDDFARTRDSEREQARIRFEDVQARTKDQLAAQLASHDRETKSQAEAHRRELESIRTAESSKGTVIEKTSQMGVKMAESELNRVKADLEKRVADLTAENSECKRELKELQKPKDPATFLVEAKQFARDVLGMVDKDEILPPEPGSEPKDWKQQAVDALREIIPEAGKMVLAARGQAVAQQPQQMPPPQQATIMIGPGPQQAQPQRQRRPMASPPGWAQEHGPPPPGSPPPGPQPMAAPAYMPSVIPQQPFAPQRHEAVMPAVAQQVPMASSPVQPSGVITEVDIQQHIGEFVEQLNASIGGRMVDATTFAQMVVQRVGAPTVAKMVHMMTVDKFIEMCEGLAPRGAPVEKIISLTGREYTEEVWRQAEAMVTGQ